MGLVRQVKYTSQLSSKQHTQTVFLKDAKLVSNNKSCNLWYARRYKKLNFNSILLDYGFFYIIQHRDNLQIRNDTSMFR